MYSPATGGSPPRYHFNRTRRISIHEDEDFAPTRHEIIHYLEYRCNSRPFVDVDNGHRDLWTLIRKWIKLRMSRCSNPNAPQEVEYVTVTGRHGLNMRIGDFYSALGFVISETDPYVGHGNETRNELRDRHFKMLATYTKWIRISAEKIFDLRTESPPTTACVMFAKVPKEATGPAIVSESGIRRDEFVYHPAAVFPNLSGPLLKNAAQKLQVQNMNGFFPGLSFSGMSPRQLAGYDIHFGHCSEILGLLYMLDPATLSLFVLGGVATATGPIAKMTSYNAEEFKDGLKEACGNCQYVVRGINESMGSMVSGGFPAFQYDDYASRTAAPIALPRAIDCARHGCTAFPSRTYECGYCRDTWYCSLTCKQTDAPGHLLSRCGPKICIVCRTPTTQCCSHCLKKRNKVPTRYCSAEHQRNDWPTHMLWCKNDSATGVEPRYY